MTTDKLSSLNTACLRAPKALEALAMHLGAGIDITQEEKEPTEVVGGMIDYVESFQYLGSIIADDVRTHTHTHTYTHARTHAHMFVTM